VTAIEISISRSAKERWRREGVEGAGRRVSPPPEESPRPLPAHEAGPRHGKPLFDACRGRELVLACLRPPTAVRYAPLPFTWKAILTMTSSYAPGCTVPPSLSCGCRPDPFIVGNNLQQCSPGRADCFTVVPQRTAARTGRRVQVPGRSRRTEVPATTPVTPTTRTACYRSSAARRSATISGQMCVVPEHHGSAGTSRVSLEPRRGAGRARSSPSTSGATRR